MRIILSPSESLSGNVRIEWYQEWSREVDDAFSHLQYDHLMDYDVVRTLWEAGIGRFRQRIAVVRTSRGEPVGVVPLRKTQRFSWQLITFYVMPYARFFVRPEATEAAFERLGGLIGCMNVCFYETPARNRMLRPEESWVVKLEPTFEALMRRTEYSHNERRCRKRARELTLVEDKHEDLPIALDHWQRKWELRGSHFTAKRRDDLLLTYRILARQGRLKTFSLYHGLNFAAMQVNLIGPTTLYGWMTISLDEYKQHYAGIRNVLASMQWGCERGMLEYDLLRTGDKYKRAWAVPEVRGYTQVRRWFNSESLGCAVEQARVLGRRLRREPVPRT